MSKPPSLEFGQFRLERDPLVLTRGNERIELASRALQILATLAQRAGQVITKEELLSLVWPKTIVEEGNLAVHISALRKALGVSVQGKSYIATVPKRGYVFTASVSPWRAASCSPENLHNALDGRQEQAVRQQLERLVAGPAFSSAPRLSSLLRYLVEETLAGRGDQLKEYTLGVEVLGRGSHFDPRLDSIVRVEASKLRARLAAYYQDAGANDTIRIELPRGSYVPRFVTCRENPGELPLSAGVLAVLPFANLGPEPDLEYLADGLTEEVIDSLGLLAGMRVVARTSAFQFKGKSGNIQEIGRALGAGYLIEGSVRQSQNRFRVNARLIEAKTGYRLWSQAYDQPLGEVFGIQIAIAEGIAAALRGGRTLLPTTPTMRELTGEAYAFYLRGRFHRNQWTLEGFEKSIGYLQRALQENPDSAQVLAALAEVETNGSLSGLVPNAHRFERARAYAEQALVLDPRCAQAHLSLGWIHQLYDWQWESAQAEFNQALTLNPSFAEAWHLKGLSLALRRHVQQAEESFRQAMQFDPLSLVIHTHTALVPYFAGNLNLAESRVRAALTLDSRFAEPHWVLGLIQERQGNPAQALDHLQRAIQLGGENPVILADLAFLHTLLGNFECAQQMKAKLETGFPRPHPAASNLARLCFGLGEHESSHVWLDEAFASRDFMLPWACADPRYEGLWTRPLLSRLRERILGTAALNVAAAR